MLSNDKKDSASPKRLEQAPRWALRSTFWRAPNSDSSNVFLIAPSTFPRARVTTILAYSSSFWLASLGFLLAITRQRTVGCKGPEIETLSASCMSLICDGTCTL